MDRPRLSRAIGRLAWGSDVRPYYESMEAIAETPAGGTVVDCPCGAGPAFRALSPGADLRYLAFDVSPSMLARAREKAAERGLDAIEVARGEASALPVEPASVDLFLCFWGMHCYADPRGAVAEIGRVLRPGGRLVGSCFVNEPANRRQRLLLKPNFGDLGPLFAEAELLDWMGEAGLSVTSSGRSGAWLFFDARAAGGPPGSAELGDKQP